MDGHIATGVQVWTSCRKANGCNIPVVDRQGWVVGAGGVGRIIETQRIFLRFDRISPIIVLILFAVIAIEQFSVWLRRKIL